MTQSLKICGLRESRRGSQVRFELVVALVVVALDDAPFEHRVHSLDLAACPRMMRLRQAMLDVVVPAHTVEQMMLNQAVGPDLAAYGGDGRELTYDEVRVTCRALGWRAARRHDFASINDMVSHAATLPRDDEGLVIRFSGLRLKLKGAEYRRIHALISRCTPLAMWEAMVAGDNMGAVRRDLPEEFWTDFDDIVRLPTASIARARISLLTRATA